MSKILGFYPYYENDQNQYTGLMKEAISLADPNIQIQSFPRFRDILKRQRQDVVWLNWYENLLPLRGQFIKDFFIKIGALLILRFRKTKIISVLHNKEPHESTFPWLNKLFMKLQFGLSNNIVVLNGVSLPIVQKLLGKSGLKKVVKVPHPSYKVKPKTYPETPSKFNALFFGILRPYKNIELILALAKSHPEIKFTIAGKPYSEDYECSLKKQCKDLPNVELILRHLEDPDLDILIDKASILLLPYNLRSSLNSGVFFYAASKGINVIIPEIGSVKEVKNRDKLYLIKTEQHYLQELNDSLEKASIDYRNNYSEFIQNSKIISEEIFNNNSILKISNIISENNLLK